MGFSALRSFLSFVALTAILSFSISSTCFAQANDSDNHDTLTLNDKALSAVFFLLDHYEQDLPPCGEAKPVKGKKIAFGPLIAKCPEDKPFCLPVEPTVSANSKSSKNKRKIKYECTDTFIKDEEPPVEEETGTISAFFHVGPTCPGAATNDRSCADAPYQGKVDLLAYADRTDKAQLISSFTTKDGKVLFEDLKPSNEQLSYVLKAYPTFPKAVSETAVKVVAGKIAKVDVPIDSGIR